MANYFQDNDDLRFYVDQAIDWKPLVELVETGLSPTGAFESAEEAVDFYREVLDMVGAFVADEVTPNVKAMEQSSLSLEGGEVIQPEALTKLFSQIAELGLHGMSLPREFGGMNAPLMVYMLTAELMARADVSVMTHHGFHGGMAMCMFVYSMMEGSTIYDAANGGLANTRFRSEIEEILRGEAWGSMDITEPGAGSDMAALRTRGEQDELGNWYITGEKCFITSGHGKYHFVIARTEHDNDGLSGLSFFLVPAYEDTAEGRHRFVKVERLEEKLGHHCSATCTLVFDRSPAHLIGQRGEGFKYMLMLMNNARLNVGFESIGLCESAYRLAAEYASERQSMGKTIDQHEMIADYLDEMRTCIQGMRALSVEGAYHNEMAHRAEMRLKLAIYADESEKSQLESVLRRHKGEARRLTPLIKYLTAEKAVEISRQTMQIHGGVGYSSEYGAEKLLRDSLVLPIYEGTSQIQALMTTKDVLGGFVKNPQELIAKLAQCRWRMLSSRAPLDRQVARVHWLTASAQQTLLQRVIAKKLKTLPSYRLTDWPTRLMKDWDPSVDFSIALLHAERLTEMLAHNAICCILEEQTKRWPERQKVLARYVERALPRCEYLLQCIRETGDALLKRLANPDSEKAA